MENIIIRIANIEIIGKIIRGGVLICRFTDQSFCQLSTSPFIDERKVNFPQKCAHSKFCIIWQNIFFWQFDYKYQSTSEAM